MWAPLRPQRSTCPPGRLRRSQSWSHPGSRNQPCRILQRIVSLAILWQHCDNTLATLWQHHGNALATLWQRSDNTLATLWQHHDNTMTTPTCNSSWLDPIAVEAGRASLTCPLLVLPLVARVELARRALGGGDGPFWAVPSLEMGLVIP